MKNIRIRNERSADIRAIHDLTRLAFQDHPFSQHTEPFIIEALREANALVISLVAELDSQIVGHIAFSPVSIDGSKDWYGLGPLSVVPDKQRQGIGSMLLRAGLERLKQMGAKGCALVGDPAYYLRFGFKNHPELICENLPQKFFLTLNLDPSPEAKMPQGVLSFHEAFFVKVKG